MKKLTLACFTFFISTSGSFSQLGSWSPKANFAGMGRTTATGFSIGSYGYVGTGFSGTPQKDFWRFNPVSNSWTQMADFGGIARSAAVGFAINGNGYIGTGINSVTYYVDFWKYDTAANSWTQVANFPGSARAYAAAFVIGNKAYVGTGMNSSTAYNSFYEYDLVADSWTPVASIPAPFTRADAFAFAVSGKGYVGCGRNQSGSTFYSDMYEYSPPPANSWTAKANFPGTPAAREGLSAFVIGNYGYAGLGSTSNFNTQYTDFYRYDPVGNSWSPIATFTGTARTNCASFAIGNFGYVATGYTFGNYTTSHYEYSLCGIALTTSVTAVSCNGGNNGSINLTVSNSTLPHTYQWSNSATTEDISGLTAGTYSVIVTDGMGCTKTATVTVTQPTALVANVSSVGNVKCNSGCDGSITISVLGGTPTYTYLWMPTGNTTGNIAGLCAGGYTLVVTDSKGCTTTVDTVITQPSLLTASATVTNASSACICDGSANIIASGGTPPYAYQWCTGATTSSVTGLCPGANCVVSVADSNGCAFSDTVVINPAPLTLSMTATNASCFPCTDGTATANPSGGTQPYTFQWANSQTTQMATGLAPGTYSVCVYDADSCSICDSVFVGFSVGVTENQADAISIFPNPAKGIVKLRVNDFRLEGAEIKIYNALGEKVYSVAQLPARSIMINLSGENGIYFLKIQSSNTMIMRKIILEK